MPAIRKVPAQKTLSGGTVDEKELAKNTRTLRMLKTRTPSDVNMTVIKEIDAFVAKVHLIEARKT